MFRSIIDFGHEYPRIIRGLDFWSMVYILTKTILALPEIVRETKLAPLDRSIGGNVSIIYRGSRLHFPIGRIDAILAGSNDSLTFGGVREMFFNDVYLWPFLPFSATCVIDLGANRCFFGLIARKILNANLYVAVEPLKKYDAVAEMIFAANGILPTGVRIYRKRVGARTEQEAISLRSIIDDLQIKTIGFLKVDIEGGEYDVFQSPDWLELVENIALEVHPPADQKAALFAKLERAGFKAFCVDTRRNPIAPEYAEYIFASRNAHAFANPVR